MNKMNKISMIPFNKRTKPKHSLIRTDFIDIEDDSDLIDKNDERIDDKNDDKNDERIDDKNDERINDKIDERINDKNVDISTRINESDERINEIEEENKENIEEDINEIDEENIEEDIGYYNYYSDNDNYSDSDTNIEYSDDFEDEDIEVYSDNLSDYLIVNISEVKLQMKELLTKIKNVFGVNNNISFVLLDKYNWDSEKLLNNDFDNICQIINNLDNVDINNENENENDEIVCSICFDPCDGRDSYYALDSCKHIFCNECWKEYLITELNTSTNIGICHCPQYKCNQLVDKKTFYKFFDRANINKYKIKLIDSFINLNPYVKYCPSPICDNIIISSLIHNTTPVKCTCLMPSKSKGGDGNTRFSFCFECVDYDIGDHTPASCKQTREWDDRVKSDLDNANWIRINTKPCPQCGKNIEKNGGCLHMTCNKKIGGCGHHFCWLCLGSWDDHSEKTGGYYGCNRFDKGNKKQLEKLDKIRRDFDHYSFYLQRFDTYNSSIKYYNSSKIIDSKIGLIIDKFGILDMDKLKFIRHAVIQLVENARVLKWSNVYGFNINKDDDINRGLFEYAQQDLERYNNKLSDLFENDIELIYDDHAFFRWRSDIIKLTELTHVFAKKFVEELSNK